VNWEVIIVGAGPAGLSAALILGRCRRRVLVLDTNRPRNAASRAMHGFLSRDGVNPRDLRRIGRAQLARYDTIQLEGLEARRARAFRGGFQLTLSNGTRARCRKLLIATGVIDDVPSIEGFDDLYGRSVFHCPYCDGWECRDQPLAVYGRRSKVVGLATELKVWSRDLVACSDGFRLTAQDVMRLNEHRIPFRMERIASLDGANGQLKRVVFVDGSSIDRRYLFFSSDQRQGSDLAAQLGCAFTRRGAVRTGEYEVTDIPGLYAAGDASRLVQLAIVAASEGAQAAFAINTALMTEDLVA
jgi:thioredoxin reductase